MMKRIHIMSVNIHKHTMRLVDAQADIYVLEIDSVKAILKHVIRFNRPKHVIRFNRSKLKKRAETTKLCRSIKDEITITMQKYIFFLFRSLFDTVYKTEKRKKKR